MYSFPTSGRFIMSVANSGIASVAPTAAITSIAGSRRLRHDSTAIKLDDEASKRTRSAWFETELCMVDYRRDKKNEERGSGLLAYVRINSKRLRCSYEIPAEDCYDFLKKLRKVLAPGLRVRELDKNPSPHSDQRRLLNTLEDWICSDFTVQVFPKTPTVLWLDIDCLKCKSETYSAIDGQYAPRHIKSVVVIETVLAVVNDYRSREIIPNCTADSERLYVTRGGTCGMHLFFPQIVIHNESDMQELWSEVSRRLRGVDSTAAAAVDTGCSSMPLPLAREHSGLTRIVFNSRHIITRSHITKPSLRDIASVTNFYHFVVNRFGERDDTDSPPSSLVGYGSGGTAVTTCDTTKPDSIIAAVTVEKVEVETATAHTATGELSSLLCAALSEHTENGDNVKEEKTSSPSLDEKENRMSSVSDHSAATTKSAVDSEKEVGVSTVSDKHSTGCENKKEYDRKSSVSINNSVSSNTCNDKADDRKSSVSNNNYSTATDKTTAASRSSSSAASKQRDLVQTNIKDIYAKIERDRKRKKSQSSASSEPQTKLSRLLIHESRLAHEEPIVIQDDEDNDERFGATRLLKIKTDIQSDEEAASSFLCAGYLPRTQASSSTYRGAFSSATTVASTSTTTPEEVNSSVSHDTTYGVDISLPPDARVPVLYGATAARRKGGEELQRIERNREHFKNNMTLSKLNVGIHDQNRNQTHETDIQFLLSGFNTELDFYKSVLKDSSPFVCDNVAKAKQFDGLRIKSGCSLHDRRENCPPAIFPENMPFVLYTEDYVTEAEWLRVLIRYFDQYLNSAPFLLVMSFVLRKDTHVKNALNERTRQQILGHVQNCLSRFKCDAMQSDKDAHIGPYSSDGPKHPHEDKCAVVTGLIAVCSMAFEIKTPVFTDFTKVCRLLLNNKRQMLDSINTSTMSIAGTDSSNSCDVDESTYDSVVVTEDDRFFDESVSQAAKSDDTCGEDNNNRTLDFQMRPKRAPSHIGNNHSVLASLLRWNYTALADHTLWSLFYYYYHVHTDVLERINVETLHGGLMVTAVLQAYLECVTTRNSPVTVRQVCNQVYVIDSALETGDDKLDSPRMLMPPPATSGAGGGNNKRKTTDRSATCELKKQKFEDRHENSKKAQRKVQEARDGLRDEEDDDDDDDEKTSATSAPARQTKTVRTRNGREKDKTTTDNRHVFKTNFDEVLSMMVHRYLRPMIFDEATVVYTETGYNQGQNEFSTAFDKSRKQSAVELFKGSTIKYVMPHGELLMYNTDVMGTVHRRSTCANNLVLNVFENMYGGCVSFLTRRYDTHLKLHNRFNGDAYRLVVECRHAMTDLVRSIETSYLNLILRQPIVSPVLEADIAVRNMFMCEEELMKGAFVCLNAMDYVRAVNMFTKHTKFSQQDCATVESFLDDLTTAGLQNTPDDNDEEAGTLFRIAFLFYMLYIFEVLYKIRHAYQRDGSYSVSVERLSWELEPRVLIKLFFGAREFKSPRGLSPRVVRLLDSPAGLKSDHTLLAADIASTYVGPSAADCGIDEDDDDEEDATDNCGGGANRAAAARCINTRPLVSTSLPNKRARMVELFGKKGLNVMKSYAPLDATESGNANNAVEALEQTKPCTSVSENSAVTTSLADTTGQQQQQHVRQSSDQVFINMTQTQLEEALYSAATWYDNCSVRVMAVKTESAEEAKLEGPDTCMDAASMDTFLRTQLRVHIDNNRLAHIERAVRRDRKDFRFCTQLPLRVKTMALVLATHSVKRLTTCVAEDFCRKEYRLERSGVSVMVTKNISASDSDGEAEEEEEEHRPDQEWTRAWNRLLCDRRRLLVYCRSLADKHFPDSYFAGLKPDTTYEALYSYMTKRPDTYVTLHALRDTSWAADVCVALNYLLVINGYDPELVELCLRLFLGIEWPGQWAKRIFVWKSNSNAGKSLFFEHVLRKAFDQSTCINDPKGGKENAPEKSEYYKNFVLMINEFSIASTSELKKICSTSGYTFRMNFGNHMINAFAVGKLVFNCNSLPLTTDHATIQRVALVPLPFWFQKRQSVVESMLNWTRGQCSNNEYEKNFKRNVSQMLNTEERRFFLENQETKNEDDLFNKPNEMSLQSLTAAESSDHNEVVKASMFQVQNKTSHVYMSSSPPVNKIVAGIVAITRYFCRFRFFNNVKEPVDYSVLPTACNVAAHEWQRISQPYFEWKERYRVQTDHYARTKISTIYASLNHFAKGRPKTSFFDLKQFFECDFADQKTPHFNAREDEYNVRLDPLED